MTQKKELVVECPKCKVKFKYHLSDFRPFCSKRCKMVDLGRWLDESYAIPSQENEIEEEIDDEDK